MHFDSSLPKKEGDRARIRTIKSGKTANSLHCLEYFFWMYGDHVGELNIYLVYDGEVPDQPQLPLKGSTGQGWIKLSATIPFGATTEFEVIDRNLKQSRGLNNLIKSVLILKLIIEAVAGDQRGG